MDVIFFGYANLEEYTMDRAPAGWGALSSGGIQVDSILILTALSILPWPRSYRLGIHPNPTYTIYPIADHLAVNPMDWITAWRRRNWP